MKCDACKGEELVVIKVPRYSRPVVLTGYVLSVIALFAAVAAGMYAWQLRSAGNIDPAALATQNGVARLQQIEAVTPEIVKDFQDDGQVSETLLSKLAPDDRADVEKVVSDFKTGALAAASSSDRGWVMWVIVFGACVGVCLVAIAMTRQTEELKCVKCGAINVVPI